MNRSGKYDVQKKHTNIKDFEIDYDGETPLFDEECKLFMENFVNEVFLDGYISNEEKAKFGLLMQHPEGREWFGKFIEYQRANNKEVDEFTFYRLVQYFAVCLFECNLSDDFGPATSIMNMCFTFHFTAMIGHGRMGQERKQFVYEYLKDQSIWHSLRFWNAAFLHAIHADRKKRTGGMEGWSGWNLEQRNDFELSEENSSFAHLASFLYMMKSLDVSKKDRDIFRDKMSTIGNLRPEQVKELEESVEFLQ